MIYEEKISRIDGTLAEYDRLSSEELTTLRVRNAGKANIRRRRDSSRA